MFTLKEGSYGVIFAQLTVETELFDGQGADLTFKWSDVKAKTIGVEECLR